MPRLTPGNRLYFYQLLSTRLGVGVQTPLPKVEELLSEEDVDPADVGCDDVQQLLSQMPEFIKLTVFKKGRTYVTVQRQEEWDQVLAHAGEERQRKAPAKGAKAWKHKKSSKDPKPAKPRHRRERRGDTDTENAAAQRDEGGARAVESAADAAEPAETVTRDEPKAAPTVEADDRATETAQVPSQAGPDATAAEAADAGRQVGPSEATSQGDGANAKAESPRDAGGETHGAGEPQGETDAAASAEHAPVPKQGPAAGNPGAAPTDGEPPIKLTITYDPYRDMEEDLDAALREAEDGARREADEVARAEGGRPLSPRTEAKPSDRNGTARHDSPRARKAARPDATAERPEDSEPATPAVVASDIPSPVRLQADLPQDFASEVHCTDRLLQLLYRTLPIDADVMSVLDEDWRVARSTGSLGGTRSKVTFPLRYLQEDGSSHVMVTLRRSSKATAGKRWALAYVDGDDGTGDTHQAVGLEGLPKEDEGAWSDLAGSSLGMAPTASPARELAQFAVIGSWDELLGALATMAAPERWNYPGEGVGKASRYGILREYLTVTFHRLLATDGVRIAADGSLAAFDTGLHTAFWQDIYACFAPHRGDIPWQFSGFCTAGSGELGALLVASLDPLPQPARYLERIGDVFPQPGRMVVLDTESLVMRQLGRLPRAFLQEQVGTSSVASEALGRVLSNPGDARAQTELSRAIKGDPGTYRRVGRALDDACDLALRRARSSYRTVAPAFDPQTDSMRLLLPLCLVSDDKADCALALAPQPTGNYQGTAVLSLPRAYVCSRVVGEEQPSWLQPQDVLA